MIYLNGTPFEGRHPGHVSTQETPSLTRGRKQVEQQLSETLGENASAYAQVRAKAAQLRGANGDAEEWDAVARDLGAAPPNKG